MSSNNNNNDTGKANLGEAAINLIQDLNRTNTLGMYDEQAMQTVIREINQLFSGAETTILSAQKNVAQPFFASNVIVQHLFSQRNKRCALNYLFFRLKMIESLRWELNADIPQEMVSMLSNTEKDYLVKYDQMLEDYFKLMGLDLSESYDRPPKEIYLEVRILEDCWIEGKLLHEGTIHYLCRNSEVETLLRAGKLKHVK